MRKSYLLVLLTILVLPTFSQAKDIYVAQDLAGAGSGSNCDNAYSAAWFNTARNWGNARTNSGTRIEPGTTIHLCGVIANTLIVQSSGTPGTPITILFEKDAKLSQPVCPSTTGCFNMNSRSYVVLDGGINGIIESTDNGTMLGNRLPSIGVSAQPCSNCEIKNLTIQNMYVHTYDLTDNTVNYTLVNSIKLAGSNTSVHNNILHDAGWAIYQNYRNGDKDVSIYSNDIYNISHGWTVAGNGRIHGSNFKFFDNHVHDYSNWDTNTNTYHHDGIHAYGIGGAVGDQYDIYNNIFEGECGKSITGHVYMEPNPSSRWSETGLVRIFNNVFKCTTEVFGMVRVGPGTAEVYNNTIIGGRTSICLLTSSSVSIRIVNNAISGCKHLVHLSSDTKVPTSAAVDIDYNTYRTYASNSFRPWHWQSVSFFTASFETWKVNCGCDRNSTTNVSLLEKQDGSPRPESPMIDAGANLTVLGIAALNRDRVLVPRPSQGLWSTGAYQAVHEFYDKVAPFIPQNLQIE